MRRIIAVILSDVLLLFISAACTLSRETDLKNKDFKIEETSY